MRQSENKTEYAKEELRFFMQAALSEAKKAAEAGEVPIGAVIVKNKSIVSAAYNTRETGKNALHHAEIKAIAAACETLHGWRLHECDLFVTLEPCVMCAGAAINARIRRIYYGAPDEKAGGFGSILDVRDHHFNHMPLVTGGLLAEESAALLSRFFSELREMRAKKKQDTEA